MGSVIQLMGDDNIVFSTDYPHSDSEFPPRGGRLHAAGASGGARPQDPVGQLHQLLRDRSVGTRSLRRKPNPRDLPGGALNDHVREGDPE